MAIDSSTAARNAIMGALAEDAAVSAIVGDRVYSQTVPGSPTFPFVRYGSPTPVPISASCLDGAEITVSVDAFAKPLRQGAQVTERAEDLAGRLGAAIAEALDRRKIAIDRGHLRIRWRGSLIRRDGDEADAYQVVVNLRVRCFTQ